MKKILSIVLAIAIGLSLSTMAFAVTDAVSDPTQGTVVFKLNNGAADVEKLGTPGATVAYPAAPTKTGYTFTGWNPPTMVYPAVGQPVTVNAVYTEITTATPAPTGTILFVLDNGQVYKYMTGPSGSTLTADPAIPTKAGFTFGAWEPAIAGITYPYPNANGVGQTTVVTAKWVSNETTAAAVVPTTESAQVWLDLFTEQVIAISKDEKVKDLAAKAKEILDKGTTADIAALADDLVKQISDKTGIDTDTIKGKLSDNELVKKFMGIYQKAPGVTTTAAPTEVETTDLPVIPDTGSAVGGIAIFATLSIAAAAAFVCSKKN